MFLPLMKKAFMEGTGAKHLQMQYAPNDKNSGHPLGKAIYPLHFAVAIPKVGIQKRIYEAKRLNDNNF